MAQKIGTPLENVSQLKPAVVEALRPLWITTVEELVTTAYEDKGRAGLAELLGMASAEVEAMAHDLLPLLLPEIRSQIAVPPRAFGMGALDKLDRGETRGIFDRLPVPAVLPPRVSLVDRLPAIRNQGMRGTCVAHACAAVREYLTGDTDVNFSEQFLYWAARQKLGIAAPILANRPGALLISGMQALQDNGICAEEDYPYSPDPIAGDETQGAPPQSVQEKARAHRIDRWVFVWPRDIRSVKAHLAGGYAVACTLPTFFFWSGVMMYHAGAIRLPLLAEGVRSPLARLESAHAICLAGYQDDATVPGGGYFIVRNSWGTGWGAWCPDGPGYCWLPYAYLQRYGLTAFTAV